MLLAPLLQPPPAPDASAPKGVPSGGIPQPACALFVLERLLLLLEYRPLVNNIALALLGRDAGRVRAAKSGFFGSSPGAAYDLSTAMMASTSSPCPGAGRLSPVSLDCSDQDGQMHHPLDPYSPGSRYATCREALIALLRGAASSSGGSRADQLSASGVVRVLVAVSR